MALSVHSSLYPIEGDKQHWFEHGLDNQINILVSHLMHTSSTSYQISKTRGIELNVSIAKKKNAKNTYIP